MRSILVVDDDSLSRKALCAIFERLNGLEVCSQADSESKAIEEAGRFSPDLIIVGLSMQDSGLTTFVLDLKGVAPGTSIFLLTVEYGVGLEKRALSAGVTAVFSKFDDYEALVQNAQRLFDLECGAASA